VGERYGVGGGREGRKKNYIEGERWPDIGSGKGDMESE